MTGLQFIFYFFAFITVLSALTVLLTKNVIHAVLALLGVFLGVSAMYIFAGADFLAVSQLIVYIGGVLVLLLFGVMLTNKEAGKDYPVSRNNSLFLGILSGLLIFMVLLYLVFVKGEALVKTGNENNIDNTITFIGIALIKEYSIAFELIGFVLLVTLIGAAFIAGRKNIAK